MIDERKRILIIFLVSLRDLLLTISYLFLSPLVAVAMVAR